MQFLGRKEGKALSQIKAHLVTKDAESIDSRAVSTTLSTLKDVFY